jgi:hypothetical protein
MNRHPGNLSSVGYIETDPSPLDLADNIADFGNKARAIATMVADSPPDPARLANLLNAVIDYLDGIAADAEALRLRLGGQCPSVDSLEPVAPVQPRSAS